MSRDQLHSSASLPCLKFPGRRFETHCIEHHDVQIMDLAFVPVYPSFVVVLQMLKNILSMCIKFLSIRLV